MNEPGSSAKRCTRCGATVSAQAPEGLCPRCLGALNLAGETIFTETEPPRPAVPSVEEISGHFPQLEILECLGRGGMGVVYKARQKSLGRLVALKLLAPERAKDPQFAERFAREAQALAQLDHPHIVTVYDFGQTNGFFYLLMEFVDGLNLRQVLQARKLTPAEALAIVPPLCDALQFAHDRGIVHRDIKPENLLLARDGRVKIADFGIAKMLGAEASVPDDHGAGTPGYMAPEQRETPPRVDNRADIYSLGVVFYELLTGERPAAKIQPPSRKVQIDVRLDEIVLRALEAKPELRFQTAAELRTEIETVTSTPAVASPPNGPAPNPTTPWSNRTFWLVLACAGVGPVLLLTGIFALVVINDNGMRLPGPVRAMPVVLMLVFAALVAFVWYGLTRPRSAQAPPAKSWGRRIFLLLAVLLAVPALLFLGLAIPYFLARSQPRAATPQDHPEVQPAQLEPAPGAPLPPAPAGAQFVAEKQVVVPADSRTSVEILQSANDADRKPLRPKLNFKTAIGSGLGIRLRWQAYGPDHPTHANHWILDLIDPQNGVAFHRVEAGFPSAVRMSSPDLRPLPETNQTSTLNAPGSDFFRILRIEEPAPPGEPVRAWWDIQVWVTLISPTQADAPSLFQLPTVRSEPSAGPPAP
jgi:predicted Ser/Thr protein kinase